MPSGTVDTTVPDGIGSRCPLYLEGVAFLVYLITKYLRCLNDTHMAVQKSGYIRFFISQRLNKTFLRAQMFCVVGIFSF